jgi:hypothetical protein
MTAHAGATAARDWLGALRAAADQAAFASLVVNAAKDRPDLKGEVCALAKERGGEEFETWARSFFSPEAQPPAATTLSTPALGMFTEGVVLRRRNLLAAAPVPDAAQRAATVAALVAKAEPDFAETLNASIARNQQQQTKPEPEAQEPQWRSPLLEVGFAAEGPDNDVNDAILSVAASYDNARAFARRRCFVEGGMLLLYRWRDKWWEWNGRTYVELPDAELRSKVYGFLDTSNKRDGKEGQLARFKPAQKHVNELIDGLKAGLMLPTWAEPPMRLDTGERLGTVMMFANGLFDLRTSEVSNQHPHTGSIMK